MMLASPPVRDIASLDTEAVGLRGGTRKGIRSPLCAGVCGRGHVSVNSSESEGKTSMELALSLELLKAALTPETST